MVRARLDVAVAARITSEEGTHAGTRAAEPMRPMRRGSDPDLHAPDSE